MPARSDDGSDDEEDSSPPSPLIFSCVRAAPPALIFWCILPLSNIAWWAPAFPVVRHLQAFFMLKADVTGGLPPLTMAMSMFASYRALTTDGWSGLSCMAATFVCGVLMQLVLTSVWDALGPYVYAALGAEDLEKRRAR